MTPVGPTGRLMDLSLVRVLDHSRQKCILMARIEPDADESEDWSIDFTTTDLKTPPTTESPAFNESSPRESSSPLLYYPSFIPRKRGVRHQSTEQWYRSQPHYKPAHSTNPPPEPPLAPVTDAELRRGGWTRTITVEATGGVFLTAEYAAFSASNSTKRNAPVVTCPHGWTAAWQPALCANGMWIFTLEMTRLTVDAETMTDASLLNCSATTDDSGVVLTGLHHAASTTTTHLTTSTVDTGSTF